jgi:hypothetical protein
MSATAADLAGSAPTTARRLWSATRDWIRQNIPSVLVSAAIGFVGGWLLNVVLMVWRYQGYQVPPGAPVSGQGSLAAGTAFWFVASTILFALIGYRRAVGRERFWHDLKSLPDVLQSLWRKDGGGARVHLLWGFAVAMVLQQVLSPSLAGVLGIGVALSVPTLLSRVAIGFSYRVYSTVSRRVAPSRKVAVPGITAMTVGMMGTAGAFLVGFVVNGQAFAIPLLPFAVDVRVLVGVAAGALAWYLTTHTQAPPAAVVLLLAVVAVELVDVLQAAAAWADDGGWAECGSTLSGWVNCGDGGPAQVAVRGTAGGIGAAVGSAVGTGLGSVLGQVGDDGGPGDDGPGDRRPPEPGGEHGWTWADDGVGIVLPDWAPPGTVMQLPEGYPGPVVFDEYGQPLWTNDQGQVQYGDDWVDPATAAAQIDTWTRNRQREMDEFQRGTDEARDRWRDRVRRDAEDARQQMEARNRARETLDQIRSTADRHGWDDIHDRAWGDDAYDADGNLDPGYVNRLRDALRNRIGRDIAAPDPDPDAPSWIEEGAIDTWNDARQSIIVRGGSAILTGGTSEILFQGADVVDRIRSNVDRAVDEGRDYGFGDAIRDTAEEFANQNLPVNTIRILLEERDPPASATEIAIALGSDLLSGADVLDSASRVRTNGLDFGQDAVRDALTRGRQSLDDVPAGATAPRSRPDVDDFTRAADGTPVPRDRVSDFGVPDANMRHVNQVADQHLVQIQVRASNPDTIRWLEQGAHPKPPDIKVKTVNDLDTYLMPGGRDANLNTRGTAAYFEPQLPSNLDDLPSDLQDQIRSRFTQRADEFADQAGKIDKLAGDGKIVVGDDGVIRHGGDGQPFTGDHDLWAITGANGEALPPAIKEQVVRDLSGPPFSAQHGAHTDWSPTSEVDMGIDARIRDSHNAGGEGLLTAQPGYGDPTVTYNQPLTPDQEMSHLVQQLRDEQYTAATGMTRPTGIMAEIEVPPQPGILSDGARDALTGGLAGINAAGQTGAEGGMGDLTGGMQ